MIRTALAAVAVLAAACLVTVTPAPADAACVNTIPARAATGRGEVCSQLRILPYSDRGTWAKCLYPGGWYGDVWLRKDEDTTRYGCRAFVGIDVHYGYEAWCAPWPSSEPLRRYWTSGYHAWNSWESIKCKLVFAL